MPYIDCYLVPVPRANKAEYERMAATSAQVVRAYGALRVTECWLDEAGPDASTYHGDSVRREANAYAGFRQAASARECEAVVMSWVEWQDKASRDWGMAKVTSDPRMQFEGQAPVFDGVRLIAGGFAPMPLSPA